jgi:hypothetical protein
MSKQVSKIVAKNLKLASTAAVVIATLAATSSIASAKGRPTVDNILPLVHVCSSTLFFRAQDMTSQQFIDSCNEVGQEESYIHNRLQTNELPVDNDLNEDLRMVIFDDYDQYNRYGKRLFNINTNNGGMYIEGDATTSNNQASFYAHEASWLRPEFSIWNLKHEYVHYLDGRFNLKGNFSDYPTNTVWWSEGVAEYISKENNNADAIALINSAGGNRTLAQVFATSYSNTVEEIYDWGYIANRFMFSNHMADVSQMREATRNGFWSDYQNFLNSWSASYEQEWQAWLVTLVGGNGVANVQSKDEMLSVRSDASNSVVRPDGSKEAKDLAHRAYHLRSEVKSLTLSIAQLTPGKSPAAKAALSEQLQQVKQQIKAVKQQRVSLR